MDVSKILDKTIFFSGLRSSSTFPRKMSGFALVSIKLVVRKAKRDRKGKEKYVDSFSQILCIWLVCTGTG